jgi:SAM-dependent methyltransferase
MTSTTIDTTAAQAYEDYLVGPVFGRWAERVVELGKPKPGETVLDVACGSGIGARLAGPRLSPGGTMISADSDAGMVAVAEQMGTAAGLPQDVTFEWHATPAEEQVADDGSVDLCLYMQGPQFVSDPPAAMAMVYRALKPGGRLAASMWSVISDNKGHYAIAQALEARGLASAAKPFSLGDPQAAQALISGAGFQMVSFETAEIIASFPSAQAFVDGVAAGAPATRHAIAQLSDADRGAFIDDVKQRLSIYEVTGGIALPTRAHLALAMRS